MSAVLAQAAAALPAVNPGIAGADEALWQHRLAMDRLVRRIERANDAWRQMGRSTEAFFGDEGKRVAKRLDRVAAARAALLDAAMGLAPETMDGLRDKAELALLAGFYGLATEHDQRPAMLADAVLRDLLTLT